jgi:hypothetical protein
MSGGVRMVTWWRAYVTADSSLRRKRSDTDGRREEQR